jgi:hypothetical protein
VGFVRLLVECAVCLLVAAGPTFIGAFAAFAAVVAAATVAATSARPGIVPVPAAPAPFAAAAVTLGEL